MKIHFTPDAIHSIRGKRAWWEGNRDKAPDLFRRELAGVIAKLKAGAVEDAQLRRVGPAADHDLQPHLLRVLLDGVGLSPPGTGPAVALALTVRRAARALPITGPRMWTKPAAADSARARAKHPRSCAEQLPEPTSYTPRAAGAPGGPTFTSRPGSILPSGEVR